MQDDVLNVLPRLLLLLLVISLVTEPPALASNSVHGVPVSTFVEIFRSLFGNFSLGFEFRASCAADQNSFVLFWKEINKFQGILWERGFKNEGIIPRI